MKAPQLKREIGFSFYVFHFSKGKADKKTEPLGSVNSEVKLFFSAFVTGLS